MKDIAFSHLAIVCYLFNFRYSVLNYKLVYNFLKSFDFKINLLHNYIK